MSASAETLASGLARLAHEREFPAWAQCPMRRDRLFDADALHD